MDMPSTIEDLHEELLEYILSLVCPYKDLEKCKLVCKQWYYTTKRVIQRKQSNFLNSLKKNKLEWEHRESNDKLSPRFDFASCCVDGTVYIFGGRSTRETEFNDLISLNLSDRKWKRIISSGNIPSPKAKATMCAYKNQLILYGGCAIPSRAFPFQEVILFNELHIYDIKKNFWTKVSTPTDTRITAHTATIHKNRMVVIGGYSSSDAGGAAANPSEDVRCLNLETFVWSSFKGSGPQPPLNVAQSQIYIDDNNLLLVSLPMVFYLLTMDKKPWRWTEIKHENAHWMPYAFSNFPIIRVDDHLINFSGSHRDIEKLPEAKRLSENLSNVLNFLGAERPFREADRLMINRAIAAQHQLKATNLHMADISDIVKSKTIFWREPRFYIDCPCILDVFSMFLGYAELVIIGQGRSTTEVHQKADNYVLYAKAPKFTL